MHRVFKKAVAGISALAMAATLSAVAAPAFAAENAQLEKIAGKSNKGKHFEKAS